KASTSSFILPPSSFLDFPRPFVFNQLRRAGFQDGTGRRGVGPRAKVFAPRRGPNAPPGPRWQFVESRNDDLFSGLKQGSEDSRGRGRRARAPRTPTRVR